MKLRLSADKRLRSSSIDMPDNLRWMKRRVESRASTGKAPVSAKETRASRVFRAQKGGLILSRTH